MVECKNCSREIPNDSVFCPYCGLKRSFLVTNYGLPSEASEIVASTLSSISSYFLSGSALDVQQYQGSPIVQAEHEEFLNRWARMPEDFLQSIQTSPEAVQELEKKTNRDDRAINIVRLVGETNRIFLAKRSATLFRENHLGVVNELHTPCSGYDNFIVKIASLATLFEVNLTPLRCLITNPGNKGRIQLIEEFLDQRGVTYNSNIIETWKNIKILRNMPPLHAGRRDTREARRYLGALRFFGISHPINYPDLWDAILGRFLESLVEWQNTLQQV